MSAQNPKKSIPAGLLRWLLAAVLTVVVSVMLMFLAGVFHPKVPATAATQKQESADQLRTTAARVVRRPRFETATGTVRPVHEAAIAARLLARVTEITVSAGQSVVQDQVLVKLDDADLQTRLKQHEAALAQAQAQYEQTVTEMERATQLKQKNAISQAQLDAATTALKSSEAVIMQAEQSLREAQVMLGYATIRSPISGTVVDKRIEAGETVTPGQILLTLFDPTHMQMVVSVRESLAVRLKPGQTLPARLDALDLDCEATISEIVPEAESASRTFTIKVTGPCPPGVWSGMFGRLQIPLDDEDVLLVPEDAIRRIGQLTMVETVQDDRVARRQVRPGRRIDGDVEILAGLKAGELVVLR